MRDWLRSHLTYANVMVTILAFIVLGGMSYAATGGNFILGQPNSASSTTSLTAPTAGKGLQVTNTSTAAAATALGLNVASGRPPLAVNSPTKVAKLNADKLDGLDSSSFIQGVGGVIGFDLGGPELAVGQARIKQVGDLQIKGFCTTDGGRAVDFVNARSSGGARLSWFKSDGTTFEASGSSVGAAGGFSRHIFPGARIEGQFIWSSPGGKITVNLHALDNSPNPSCEVHGTALYAAA